MQTTENNTHLLRLIASFSGVLAPAHPGTARKHPGAGGVSGLARVEIRIDSISGGVYCLAVWAHCVLNPGGTCEIDEADGWHGCVFAWRDGTSGDDTGTGTSTEGGACCVGIPDAEERDGAAV